MRTLFTMVVVIGVLLVVDGIAYEGQHRHRAWREAQTLANLFNYDLKRMVRLADSIK